MSLLPEDVKYPPSDAIWAWMQFLSVTSVINIALYIKIYQRQSDPSSDAATKHYEKWMKYLAGPFVLQCAWRSFLPSMYGARVVFFDTIWNSIAIARTFATIGEITWTMQVAYALIFSNEQIFKSLKQESSKVINFISYMGVAFIILAEVNSDYGVITRNYFYSTMEVILWTTALALMGLCALYLLWVANQNKLTYDCSQQKQLLLAIFVTCFCFCAFCFKSYIPDMWRRHTLDQQKGTKFMEFWEGLNHAIFHRVVSQSWDHWKRDWQWMGGYFTGGVWSSLLMAMGPRGIEFDEKKSSSSSPTKAKVSQAQKAINKKKSKKDN